MRSYVITFYRGEGTGRLSAVVGTFHDPAEGSERVFNGLAELQFLIEAAGTAWSAGRAESLFPSLDPNRRLIP